MERQPDIEITGMTADSRLVEPGYLFAALEGTQDNGADYARDAVARGAVAVLAAPGAVANDLGVPVVEDDEPRRRLSLCAARFYAPQPDTAVAVTGTSGKTSVADFVRQIWAADEVAAGSVGTLGVVSDAVNRKLPHTTPDPVSLHIALRELAEAGVDHVAIEASSHGLDQRRLDGVILKAAAFTNLSRDHLDYHPTWLDYFNAKQRLFDSVLPAGGVAVLPAGSEYTEALTDTCKRRGQRIVTYGIDTGDLHLLQRDLQPDGQSLTLSIFGATAHLTLPLIGEFQALNVLCALALAISAGTYADRALAAAQQIKGVRGRLEPVARTDNGGHVFVDYAHKPDALKNALLALRPHTKGRLIVAVGCGGDRDPGKRPEMGAIASDLADAVIVTDDNPRSEDPATIRAQMLAACRDAQEIGDRAEAIRAGVASLQAGDVFLIAGKGHEQGQEVAGTVRPFDDAEEARKAVAARTGATS